MYWSPFGKVLVALLSQQGGFEVSENYNVSGAGVSWSGKSIFLQEIENRLKQGMPLTAAI